MEHAAHPQHVTRNGDGSGSIGRAQQIEFAIEEVSRAIQRVFNPMFLAAGISVRQATVLLHLDRNGPMTQQALGERMALGKGAMGALLDRMEDSGMVRRVSSVEDRRLRLIFPTRAGEDVMQRIDALGEHLIRQMRAGTTREERRVAVRVLHRFRQNLSLMEHQGASGGGVEAGRQTGPAPQEKRHDRSVGAIAATLVEQS